MIENTPIQRFLALADQIDLGGPASEWLRAIVKDQQKELEQYEALRVAAREYAVDAWAIDAGLTTEYSLSSRAHKLLAALRPFEPAEN